MGTAVRVTARTIVTTASTDELIRRYTALVGEYYRFEAQYFGVSRQHGELPRKASAVGEAPAGEGAAETLSRMRTELEAAREAWIASLLHS
jgi:hypothetical protein